MGGRPSTHAPCETHYTEDELIDIENEYGLYMTISEKKEVDNCLLETDKYEQRMREKSGDTTDQSIKKNKRKQMANLASETRDKLRTNNISFVCVLVGTPATTSKAANLRADALTVCVLNANSTAACMNYFTDNPVFLLEQNIPVHYRLLKNMFNNLTQDEDDDDEDPLNPDENPINS
jgi:hypothetical protein